MYVHAAFRHPWHILALVVGLIVALAADGPWFFYGLLAAEVAYLAVVPRTPRFRRAVDAKHARRQRRLQRRRNEMLLNELAPAQREFFLGLQNLAARIKINYERMDGASALLMQQSQARIDALLQAFLKLLVSLNDYRRYLGDTDRQLIERDLGSLEKEASEGSEAVREIKQRRIDILRKRIERFDKAEETRELISHQLASIEDILRLVHEQSITLRDPAAINRQLDALAIEVEETENTIHELEHYLELASEANVIAPRVAERVG